MRTQEAYYNMLFYTPETMLLLRREEHIFTHFFKIYLLLCHFQSNNLTHNRTEVTLNERENACLEYDKRGDFYCQYSRRPARVKTCYF